MKPQPAVVGCFGKIPANSDFIRGSANPPVMSMLDQWLAQSMSLLSVEPRWKLHYDASGPLDFAFLGAQRRHAIAGHIAFSRDQAGRRYPLLLMSTIEVEQGLRFLGESPVALQGAWRRFDAISHALQADADTLAVLETHRELPAEVLPDTAAAGAAEAYMRRQTLGQLERMLADAGYRETVRRMLLALGLLLRPVAACRSDMLENCLRLPLPAGADRAAVAACLLSLIAPFMRQGDFELALLMPQARNDMLVGFSGASPRVLHAAIDPHAAGDYLIGLDDCAWVDAEVARDPRLAHLACMLDQPNLPLASAQTQFENAFL